MKIVEHIMEKIVDNLSHVMKHVRPHVAYKVGPLEITDTIITTWIMMIVLFAVVFFMTRNLSVKPTGKRQHILEMIIDFILDLLDSILGRKGRKYLPLVATLFIFILFLNLAWFIPILKPPTMDISITGAIAVSTMLIIQIIGIREKGIVGYVKHFFEPVVFLFPINILEELVKPFSLALRLFGNMFGEKMVVTILFLMVPLLLPVPIQIFGVLMGVIQALVFTVLPIIYIAGFVHGH